MTHIRLYQAPIRPDKTQLILSYQHRVISANKCDLMRAECGAIVPRVCAVSVCVLFALAHCSAKALSRGHRDGRHKGSKTSAASICCFDARPGHAPDGPQFASSHE